MVNRRYILLTAFATALAGCGSSDHPVAVTPTPVAAPTPVVVQSAGPPARAASDSRGVISKMQPVPMAAPRPHVPTPPLLVHPPVAPLKPPAASDANSAIPVNIVGSWQDDRGADLTFTEGGRFEIDAKSPSSDEVRASGTYTLTGNKATMIYSGIDIATSNSAILAREDLMKEEFMRKGPGSRPQVQAIEMKSKDECVMRLVNPGAPPTVALLKRKA